MDDLLPDLTALDATHARIEQRVRESSRDVSPVFPPPPAAAATWSALVEQSGESEEGVVTSGGVDTGRADANDVVGVRLSRDSGGLFRLVLKRAESGEVYIGALLPSDSGDGRALLREGEVVAAIDGLTAGAAGFEGLLAHVKAAEQSILLEASLACTSRLAPPPTRLATRGAVRMIGLGQEAAAGVASAAVERGIDPAAAAGLAENLHRKGEEMKLGWQNAATQIGGWWRDRTEAAQEKIEAIKQAAWPAGRPS
ncbi:hypothetical protein EMIHUDRAFT_223852 [Emiliania huxleyi CCMP1516]|uniref:PDZ domain-containing protein n=2 Tax=Emiliania huxleyi TaxID=2903 RepID=A0A0D3KTB9_EMIH1|nr:hypothetical protein EMIHUDRAFT_223852 [Emiliania huxleyi CCMP1516]EOD39004.1 hypothetical protein EMIHUDRAFT_223852 [Emiliania huxleyi CCMP1516]|eukprot:XP_005791433.1 hypothetical protein EMIHUDRAFT_223852 [Emiliania huxleyi CCMP1516]